MKRLMTIHRYLSCLVAPAMLFFAVSGAWQAFRYQDTKKDGSYTAPAALKVLSEMHKAERLHGTAGTWFKACQVAVAGAFASTAIIGVIMALQVTRSKRWVWACLAAGLVVPALLVWMARLG